jgi:uncharacterized sporulation protein YeaH/YhbH (DUF444 family)
MRPCQNLDAHYGQKKVVAPNRPQARQREALGRKLQALGKQVATAQRKGQEYTAALEALAQKAHQQPVETQGEVATWRQAGRESTNPKQRERFLVWAERLAAQGQIQQVRLRERQRRLVAEQRSWQQKLAERQSERQEIIRILQDTEDRPFYDFDLEKDD